MVLGNLLSPLFDPLVATLGMFWFVITLSLAVSSITVLAYKFSTDQILMKRLKEEIAKLNKEARKNMHDQKKAMGMHKQIMEKQMIMMKHSFRSTFITLIPIILIFGWANANLAFEPIHEDAQFTVTVNFDDYVGNVELIPPNNIEVISETTQEVTASNSWRMSGKSGEHLLEWKINGKSYFKDIKINNQQKYADPVKKVNDGIVKDIQINYKKTKLLNLLGWKLGWLGTYIIFAILFSVVLRKALKVY